MYEQGKGAKDKPNFTSWLEKGDPQRDAQVQARARAKELGVSEDEVRRDLETRRVMDWSTPLTQQSHEAQSGIINGFKRGLGLSGLAEPTRTLLDGTLMPNPQLGEDRAKFDEAIDAAQASPEAKAKAKELWGQYHDNYLTGVRSTLETMETLPGVENYMGWRERMQKDSSFNHLSENQKAERYMEEQKGRSGFVKLLDTVGSNLIAGSHDLVAGIAGTAGLLTGSQMLSDYAAEKAGEANRSTAALQYTGSDGLLHNIVGGLARAARGLAAAGATGGTVGGAAVAFVQGAGSTYANLYQHGIDQGLKPEEAHRAAAGTAIASGAVSAALGKIMPGGAQALNNPATREAAKRSFGTVLKSALKGAAEEIPQEVIDGGFNHIATEMSKGKSFNEAATSYAEQFPQSALTAALLGGGVQAAGDHRTGGQQGGAGKPPAPPSGPDRVDASAPPPRPGEQGFTVAGVDGPDVPAPKPGAPPEKPGAGVPITPSAAEGGVAPGPEAPSSSGQQIPQDTTKRDQQAPATNVNNQPAAGAPPAAPAATLKDAEKVLGNIERLKEKQKAGKLSLDEQRELAHSENVVALTQVANLEAEQQALRKLPQPRELDPAKAEALEKAREVLKRPWPGGEDTPADAFGAGASSQTSGSGGQPPANESSGQPLPASTTGQPTSRVPTPEEVGGAQKAIDKLKAQDRPLSQEEQRQLDAAEKTVARKTEANLLAQKAAVEKAGKSLYPKAAKALADALAVLARPAFANSDSLPGSHEAGNILQSSSTKPPALPDIPFPEKSPQAKVEREKRSQARSQVLEQHGIKPEDKARILSMENGKRPDPKTYMSEAFIKAHREEFIDGASRIISTNSLKKYGPSQIDKTAFVFPTSKLSDLLKEAGGDRGKLEDLLGIPRGQLGSRPLSRVDFKDPASLNIRIPSGNEAGANDQWLPGARLPTGTLEGVIDVENTTSPSWTHEDLSIK